MKCKHVVADTIKNANLPVNFLIDITFEMAHLQSDYHYLQDKLRRGLLSHDEYREVPIIMH